MTTDRRSFLSSLIAATTTSALARDWTGQTPERYPDPDVIALDPAFEKLIQGNAPIRRLHTGMLWAEGPAWQLPRVERHPEQCPDALAARGRPRQCHAQQRQQQQRQHL